MRLKKLVVKNFKSLRNCEVELGKFNVLVGPNASGKTNLIEVFKLLRKIYVEKDTNPFLEWWGYNNVVWGGKEELPITVGMLFDVDGYDVYFETTFTGTGGSFRILREVLEVRGYVTLEKIGSTVKVEHSETLIIKLLDLLEEARYIGEYHQINELDPIRHDLIHLKQMIISPFSLKVQPNESIISLIVPWDPQTMLLNIFFRSSSFRLNTVGTYENYTYAIAPLSSSTESEDLSVLSIFVMSFVEFLKYPPVKRISNDIKVPQIPRKETTLSEDASNLIPLLYNIWLREGRLPDEIAKPLSVAFPNTRVFFQLTEDGRVMMKVFEGNLELAPPGISDGLYKTLAILTATYLKPPLLMIDEIENSLHPETLELILDVLRGSESQVIITTHSPVVVDITEPSDLILVDKVEGESRFVKIKDPEKIKKFLNEKGITLSEGWLYGSLLDSDEK